ncbi:hypothetical protein F5141DRAFT_1265479 [Pisolithus sp. B1]|nr:hypothetical protein F5141DRAFT_1265479 [Pisolithus sp. B1]
MVAPPPTIVGHLTNPEATVASLVRIVRHSYDKLSLRFSVWNFITLAVYNEPALANLCVTWDFHIPVYEGKGKTLDKTRRDSKGQKEWTTMLEITRATLENLKGLWEANLQSLASILKFLYVVWQHGHEHKARINVTHQDEEFWSRIWRSPGGLDRIPTIWQTHSLSLTTSGILALKSLNV